MTTAGAACATVAGAGPLNPNHCSWLFKTILPGSVAEQLCAGCFRDAVTEELVLGRGTRLELWTVGPSRSAATTLSQHVFATIRDIKAIPASSTLSVRIEWTGPLANEELHTGKNKNMFQCVAHW